jgi:hypothetical protein
MERTMASLRGKSKPEFGVFRGALAAVAIGQPRVFIPDPYAAAPRESAESNSG